MADRGFSSLAVTLQRLNVKLLRPPSNLPGETMSNESAIETKQISSLRINVEQSIIRMRNFFYFKFSYS